MTKIDLPSGGWADVREASAIRWVDRRKAMDSLDETQGSVSRGFRALEMSMVLGVVEWSFDRPIPSERFESLDELEIPDGDVIAIACVPIQGLFFVDFSMKIENGKLKEGSPT